MIKMDFELLESKHMEIQKAHMEMRQKKDEMEKAQASLHTIVHRVYQKIVGEGIEDPVEENFRKLDDMIL